MEYNNPSDRELSLEEKSHNRSAVEEFFDRYEELRQEFIAREMTSTDYREARKCVDLIDMDDTLKESLDTDAQKLNRAHAVAAYTDLTVQLLTDDPELDNQIDPSESDFYKFIIHMILEKHDALDRASEDILSDQKLFKQIVAAIVNIREVSSLRDQLLHNSAAYQQYYTLDNQFIARTNQAFAQATGNSPVSNVFIDKPYIDISYDHGDPDTSSAYQDCVIRYDDENVFIDKSPVCTQYKQDTLYKQLQPLYTSLQLLENES